MKKSIVIVCFLIGIIISASAQVTSVKYLIDYNESSSLYDCKIVIDEGKATTYVQRKQFTTQYSLVVPTGAQVFLEESHNPLQDNHNYAGTVPCIWVLAPPFTAPAGQPESDFYYLYPTLTPQLAYNDLL